MNLPIKPPRRSAWLALLSAASLAAGLVLPAYSPASQSTARSEERAVRAEERSTRREDEREVRAREREAARSTRGEAQSGAVASETGAGQPAGETTPPVEPTSAPVERSCRVSIEASATRITAGEAVTLSGTLECPNSVSAAGQQIPIYERQGQGSSSVLASATTEANGAYEMTSAALSADTVFQVREGSHRARVTVKVTPGVTLAVVPPAAQASAAQSHGQARTRTTFAGTVTPAVTGALVALQIAYQASGERWHSVAYTHVGADGDYAFAHSFRTPGLVSVRALVHIGRHYAPAVSEALSYEVPQPQRPQLSVAASTDPPLGLASQFTTTAFSAKARRVTGPSPVTGKVS